MNKNKPWIQTYTGERFYILEPRVDQIHLWDIAHPLSLIPRFGGHSKTPVSIAAHSLIVHELLAFKSDNEMGWGLVHDAPEAYIHDISSPLKSSGLFEGYKDLEKNKYQPVIAEKFSLSKEIPDVVKAADLIALAAEAESTLTMWPIDNWTEGIRKDCEDGALMTVDRAITLTDGYLRYTPAAIEEMFHYTMLTLETR